MFNSIICAQWGLNIALLLAQKQVYGIIKIFNYKREEAAASAAATGKAAFNDWITCHGVARSTNLLDMEPRIQAEYTVVNMVRLFGNSY
jgi:hypothetical protein